MNQFENNAYFWQKIDTLYFSSSVTITQAAGSVHPKYSNLIYPVDYGYLKDTLSPDQQGIAMYKGSLSTHQVTTMIVAVDILNKDIEVKLLVGCTAEQEEAILRFVNQTEYQKTVLIRRGQEVPSWALTD